ncbi:MAG: hypothetical protein ACYCW6_17835 [Candidatus Xenobia bacterium]
MIRYRVLQHVLAGARYASIVVEKPDGLVLVHACGRLVLEDLRLSKLLDELQASDLPSGQEGLLGPVKEAEDGDDVVQLMFAEQAALPQGGRP